MQICAVIPSGGGESQKLDTERSSDKKQNNLDKDEGSKFNNLSKDGGIEMSKKKVPEENTDDNEKKTLDESSIKKESTDQEGNPLADKNRQRVNTQEVHDVAQQLEDLSLAGADDKKQGCLQARGPSGGVGKAHMFPETNYKSFNNHSDFQLPYEKQSGKRGIDSDFETPFYKFANPQEQVNYGVNLSAGVNHNLLNQDMIYHKNFSGGKMYTKPGFQDALAKPEFPDINIDDLPYAQGDFTGDDILAMAENTPTQVQHMPPFQSVGTFPTENPNRMPMMGNPPNDFGSFPTDLSYSKQKQDRDDPTSDYESSVYSPSSEVSLNSPPPSNDSGYGAPSPASDMVKSPSRMSTSGGTSPPRDGSQCGDIWSPMSEPPISPPQTVPDQCSYIDQHLDQLHDVLNVIGNDIKSQEDNRKKGPTAGPSKTESKTAATCSNARTGTGGATYAGSESCPPDVATIHGEYVASHDSCTVVHYATSTTILAIP
ncbi:hypothetical protein FSP39_016960 [Pinctada imbricata]|uniref:Uncharacterized protein n=1 Tax=Pinctada imbricata TaxID=66713 RepID=A0AA88YKS6_PINIB|nr:hypothetical protein FSP39_016960 [Pinctada imbricata]